MFESLAGFFSFDHLLGAIGGGGILMSVLWKFGFKWYAKNMIKNGKLKTAGFTVGELISKYGNKYVPNWEKKEDEFAKKSIEAFTDGVMQGMDADDKKAK